MSSLWLMLFLVIIHCILAMDVTENRFVPKESYFWETFDDESWEDRWIPNNDPPFVGEWTVKDTNHEISYPGDTGLITQIPGARHAISAKFDKPLVVTDKDFCIQFEARTNFLITCGGLYIKLLSQTDIEFDPIDFNDNTPYTIMFGPDICGATDKIHFIYRFKNPITNEFRERHLKDTPNTMRDPLTHLYTLIIRTNNTFQILVDNELRVHNHLNKAFIPEVPEEIPDPSDKKPSGWVDNSKIPDPDAVKPDDWNEDAPSTIIDENDVKPLEWLDNEPEVINDPESIKPDDWSDEDDGEWEPPLIKNPKCFKNNNNKNICGEWIPKRKTNPEYKGKWKPPMIDNPDFKGPWEAKKIPNPDYFYIEDPYKMTTMVGIGIEILTTEKSHQFSSFYVGSPEEAFIFSQIHWLPKHIYEQNAYDRILGGGILWDFQNYLNEVSLWIRPNAVPLSITIIALFFGIFYLCIRSIGREEVVPEEKEKETKKIDKVYITVR